MPSSAMNAFSLLMSAVPKQQNPKPPKTKEPMVVGVIYQATLRYCNESEPLFNVSYFGQSVRSRDSASDVANERWNEEKSKAAREQKQIGFLAALDAFGSDSFVWTVIEEKKGKRDAVQNWANNREKFHIERNGGVLKDYEKRCKQTFNQTKGGQGNHWESMDALRTKRWNVFAQELETYISIYGNALVPTSYINPITKYSLGTMVGLVRSQKTFLAGHPLRDERIEWLNNQSGWAWNALKTHEWRELCSKRQRDRLREEEKANPGCLSRRMKKTRQREEDENPGVWSRRWDKVLTAEVREKRQQTVLSKSRDLIAYKQNTLSPSEFLQWKRRYDKSRRSAEKKSADLRVVSKIVPEAWKHGIAKYRSDGTVAIAYAVVDCVDGLIDAVERKK